MHDLMDAFQQEWAIRALLASCMVGLMCGLLGCFLVLRNMALVGDALSHAVLPGVVFAFIVAGYSTVGFFTGSVIAGLLAAVGITWLQHNARTRNDAAIGIVFTAMFSIGVMGISWISRSQGVHLDLKDFLFGNVLGVSDEDIWLTSGTMLYVLLSIVVFYRYLFAVTFQPVIAEVMGISVKSIHYYLMLLLSFAIVAALQTVGVILVVAMLITPAATALLLSGRLPWVLFWSAFIGIFAAALGLVIAIAFETTPGPAMTVTATGLYLLAVLISPRRGLLVQQWQRRQLRRKIEVEDTLKEALKLEEKESLSAHALALQTGLGEKRTRHHLQLLAGRGLVTTAEGNLNLTSEGREEANRLVRAHRLWETYLVEKLGLTDTQIHEDADKYEHLLTDELLDEVDKALGFPTTDPHGSPIPSRQGTFQTMSSLETGRQARIAPAQADKSMAAALWELGLLPETVFVVVENNPDDIVIQTENSKLLHIGHDIARNIQILTPDQNKTTDA